VDVHTENWSPREISHHQFQQLTVTEEKTVIIKCLNIAQNN